MKPCGSLFIFSLLTACGRIVGLEETQEWADTNPGASASGGASGMGGIAGSGANSGAGGDSGTADAGTGGDSSSGSGGTSGTAGNGGVAGNGGSGAETSCTESELMVLIEANGGTVCVDRTEVTRKEYAAWLNTSPSPLSQESVCSANVDFTPKTAECDDLNACTSDACPQVCVDWCDAYAYCKARGARLCGRFGGGPIAYSAYTDPLVSEWFMVCSSDGLYSYPYGNEYDGSRCHTPNLSSDHPKETGTHPMCRSPRPGFEDVLDLSGNVAEWEHACDSSSGSANCRARGGGFMDSPSHTMCGASDAYPRDFRNREVGFRCCATPPD